MIQQSVNFLIIVPELFQVILINVLLLFAICFGQYRLVPRYDASRFFQNAISATKVPRAVNKAKFLQLQNGINTDEQNKPNVVDAKSSFNPKIAQTSCYCAYVLTPVLQIEPIAQLTILSLLLTCLLIVNNPLTYAIGLTQCIHVDQLGSLMSVLLCLSAAAVLTLGLSNLKRFSSYEFILLIMLSIIGMLCLIKSINLLAFYLTFELQSLSFYMLAAMRSRSEASAEAGLKYFILSAFSSAILLLGMWLVYAALGCQNFGDINIAINHFSSLTTSTTEIYSKTAIFTKQPLALTVGLGCMTISVLFKLGAAPFHAWVADVYEGSPTAITAFFATVSKIGVLTVLIRIAQINKSYEFFSLLTFVAAISLIVGSLSAMRQVKLKRLLAFSGVSNVGWFLCALIASQWSCLVIHVVVYILLNIILFSIFIYPLFRTHPSLQYTTRSNLKRGLIDYGASTSTIKYLGDLDQINKTHPCLAFAIAIAAFSLAGMPPLAGFYSKYLIINALTQTEQYFVLIVALISAVISAFYYIRLIKTMYFSNKDRKKLTFDQGNSNWFSIDSQCEANAYLISVSVILTVLFFFKPDYLIVWCA